MKSLILIASLILGFTVYAQDEARPAVSDLGDDAPESADVTTDGTREPAAAEVGAQAPKTKMETDDLRVQAQLPEAQVKRDTRTMQSEVFKTLYNKDLKPDQREDALEE
jgi:hypothetical protein